MSILFHNNNNNLQTDTNSFKEKKSIRTRNLSYEDLLVGKYIEKIEQSEKKIPTNTIGNRRLEIESPYLQKLSHSNFLNTIYATQTRATTNSNLNSVRTVRSNSRANSAIGTNRPSSQMITSHFNDNHTNNNNNNNRNETNSGIFINNNQRLQLENFSIRRERPSSAPIVKTKLSSRKKLNKQPNFIKAIACRNGTRDSSFLITAKNLNEFLNIATDRLGLPRAARRIFLENGDEIKHESQFIKNSSVYVSCGEEFEDPFLMTKNIIDKRTLTYWTSNGIHFVNNKNNNLSDKEEILIKKNDRQTKTIRFTKRIICYENGKEYDPFLNVIEIRNPNSSNLKQELIDDLDQGHFKDFLEECQIRMKIPAKIAYNWFGIRIQTIDDIPKLDKCLQSLANNKVDLSPCWISKGEGFDARGALLFTENLIKYTKENRKELKQKETKLKTLLEDLKTNKSENRSRILELNDNLRLIQPEIQDLSTSIAYLDTILSNLKSIYETQMNQGNSAALYKHIKQVNFDDRIFGGSSKRSVKLKVFINGSADTSFETLVNYRDLKLFENMMKSISDAYSKNAPGTFKFTRIFKENGEEIKKNEFKLFQNQIVWVSTGDNWIDPKKDVIYALSLRIKNLLVITNPTSVQPKETLNEINDDHEEKEDEDNEEEEEENDSIIEDENNSDSDENDEEINKLKNFFKQKPSFSKKNKNKKLKSSLKMTSQSMEVTSSIEIKENGHKTYTESLKIERVDKFIKTEDWSILNDTELINQILNEIQVSNEYLGTAENATQISNERVNQLALQCKHNKNMLLIPQLQMNGKVKEMKNTTNSLWYTEFQLWKFTQTGLIHNHFFTRLCLSLDTTICLKLDIYLKKPNNNNDNNNQYFQSDYTLNAYAVVLTSRLNSKGSEYQQWHYNKYGNIFCKNFNRQMVLTDLNLLKSDLNRCTNLLEKYDIKFENENNYNLDDINLILIDSFDDTNLFRNEKSEKLLKLKMAKSQHWAIKQEGFIAKSNREWKLSELATFKWNKLAYSWPVDEKEELIKQFSWPLTGYLISDAPILKTLEEPIDDSTRSRLRIVKNGATDTSSPVVLSRMEVKNLIKEYKETLVKDSKNTIHCTGLTYLKLEFNAFLDACTNALGLSAAARRIFDENGEEHKDLSNLEQDQIVFVSLGEAWIHPKTVREEQERKMLLNNLADDLTKIAYFNRLKLCTHFVIETYKISMQEGVRLVLGPCCLSQNQIERIKQGESINNVIEVEENLEEAIDDTKNKKAHERSHDHVDAEYAKKFRWPWEQIANKSLTDLFGNQKKSQDFENNDDAENNNNINDELRDSYDQSFRDNSKIKPRSKKSIRNAKLSSQKFGFSNGYIYCIDNPNLVLGVYDSENNFLTEVYLLKRNEDNPNLRWVLRSNNSIVLKAKPSLALSVKLPSLECVDSAEYELNENYKNKSIVNEAFITIQPTVETDYGSAYQKWFFDEDIGLLYAFLPPIDFTSDIFKDLKLNIDITAANKTQICTSYIAYDKEISQHGYYCEIIEQPDPNKNQSDGQPQFQRIQKVSVCSSCATTFRGRFKLTRMTKNQSFACYFGKSKDKLFKQCSGFKYLYGKVDLSSNEADNSFRKWLEKYLELKKQSNPKTVLNELSNVKTLYTIKLLIFKNGEGRLKSGELIFGTSIQGLLDQATGKLQLRSAARRFYTQDGTLILDVQDLIDWCLNFYKKENQKLDSTATTSKTEFQKHHSFSLASNSAVSINGFIKKSSSTNEIKESTSLLEKVEFSEITAATAAPAKNTTIPTNEIIREDSFVMNPSNNNFKPTKNELKRFINELDRSLHVNARKLLKWPVEVWVSTGEGFVSPETVQNNETKKQQKREQIDKAQIELEKQTHIMRQMAGRRMNKQTTGEYKAVKNPECPVVKEGHWSEIPFEEQQKQAEVSQLKNYVDELKNTNRNSKASSSQMYGNHPITKRILVYLNGQTPDKAVYCWATNIDELNEAVKIKFRLNKPIKFFFSQDGKIILRFEDISRDQLICVSTGREFISADKRNKDIEIKANWSRTIRETGINSTDIKVNSKLNEDINVDPFAVPVFINNNSQQSRTKQLAITTNNTNSSRQNIFKQQQKNESAAASFEEDEDYEN